MHLRLRASGNGNPQSRSISRNEGVLLCPSKQLKRLNPGPFLCSLREDPGQSSDPARERRKARNPGRPDRVAKTSTFRDTCTALHKGQAGQVRDSNLQGLEAPLWESPSPWQPLGGSSLFLKHLRAFVLHRPAVREPTNHSPPSCWGLLELK